MRIIRHTDPDFLQRLQGLSRHSEPSPQVEQTVREVVAAVRGRGDEALLEYSEKFGGPKLTAAQLAVTESPGVDSAVKRALATAQRNVFRFAKKSLRKSWTMRNSQGALVGERFDPFDRVGIYVPGGTAPLVSTAVMTCTLAKAAEVPEIVVTTPCAADGKVNDALLYALKQCGATEVYRVGGAQAIAALAYGTNTIRPVQKIFGPGNAYVVEAKRQVFGQVGVDLLPGPSEILVIADATAKPAWAAADLLAQAEHGKGSQILFVTNTEAMLLAVEAEVKRQLSQLTRQAHLAEVMEHGCVLVLVKNIKDAVKIANDYAPEHLTIMAKDESKLARDIKTSGAIFLGGWSPVAAGDFVAGPSHELPTGGAGKAFPGLTVDQFQRRTSIVKLDQRSLQRSLETIQTFSAVEGLDAHGQSAAIRFQTTPDGLSTGRVSS